MGLNPSCNMVEGTPLPVLGDPPFPLELAEVAEREIREVLPEACLSRETKTRRVFREGTPGHQMGQAGLTMYYEGQENDIEEIEVAEVTAEALGWKFRRAWYYWVCWTKTAPISQAKAEELNAVWGRQVRYEGYAGGMDADGPGTDYHVDTMEGLKALVEAIRAR